MTNDANIEIQLKEQISTQNEKIKKLQKNLYESVLQNIKLLSILELSKNSNSVISLGHNLNLICSQIQDTIENKDLVLIYIDNNDWKLINNKHKDLVYKNIEKPILPSEFIPFRNYRYFYNGDEPEIDFLKPYLNDYFKKKVLLENITIFPLAMTDIIENLGFFIIHSPKGKMKPVDIRLMEACQKQVSYILHIHYLYEISNLDNLTGLFNRRYMEVKIDYEIKRTKRIKSTFGIIFIDIDHFKIVNDTYGHGQGDQVLAKLGFTIIQSVREIDIPCRLGGEEFIIVLPETDQQSTLIVAKRIEKRITELEFKYKGKAFRITVSMGICNFNPKIDKNIELLIERADRALYLAKNSGRNRIVIDNEM